MAGKSKPSKVYVLTVYIPVRNDSAIRGVFDDLDLAKQAASNYWAENIRTAAADGWREDHNRDLIWKPGSWVTLRITPMVLNTPNERGNT